MNRRFDAIVIGSGFGGAVSACRLAQKGFSVCVLERGRSYTCEPQQTRDFAGSFFTITKTGVWNESRCKYGVIEYMSFPKLDIMRGSGVGGGSLNYYAASPRPLQAHFECMPWPAGIDWHGMQQHYSTAECMLEVARIGATPANLPLPPKNAAFHHAVNCAGGASQDVNLAINFGQSPDRLPCDFRGDCAIGCSISSKNTLDTNYLKIAEQNGAVIWPLCKATNIEPISGQGYRVHYHQFTDQCDYAIEADRVIVSASSVGSTELLLRCKYQYGTLDKISPALGCFFSINADYLYAGTLMPRGIPVCPTQGPSITAGAWFEEANECFYVEDCGITDQLRVLLRKNILRRKNYLKLLESYIQGDLPIELPLKNEIQRTWGRVNRFLPYLIMGQDYGDGKIYLDRHCRLCIDWPYENNRPVFDKIRNIMRRISCAAGGKYVENVWERNCKSFTAHPLGGCIMGDSFETSVVDERGEVRNYPNLHVIDGAIIPGPIGVNPSLTITAVAEYINTNLP